MANYKLLDFHICQTQLRFLSNFKLELKPLERYDNCCYSQKNKKKKYIVKNNLQMSGFMISCSIRHTLPLNIKEHVLFPTHTANNLKSKSQAGFFFLCMLSPILEVFQSNFILRLTYTTSRYALTCLQS